MLWTPFRGEVRNLGTFFHSYMDDSGQINKDVMLFSCIAAPWHIMEGFQNAWESLLKKHDIPYLHCAEFTSCRGPYAQKRQLKDKTDDILAEFASEIITWLYNPQSITFCAAVDCEHWRSMGSQSTRKLGKIPAAFLFEHTVQHAIRRIRLSAGDNVRIGLTFDDNSNGANMFKHYLKIKQANPGISQIVSSICFANDELYLGLQAADLLAYCCYREHIRKIENQDSPSSPAFLKLKSNVFFDDLYFNGAFLDEISKADRVTHTEFVSKEFPLRQAWSSFTYDTEVPDGKNKRNKPR